MQKAAGSYSIDSTDVDFFHGMVFTRLVVLETTAQMQRCLVLWSRYNVVKGLELHLNEAFDQDKFSR